MDRNEITYARQTIIRVKDWDRFQQVIRFYAKLLRSISPLTSPGK